MNLNRASELMSIEQECVKRASTCGRDCAHCELVQSDEELISAYDVAQLALVVLKHFEAALGELDELFEDENNQ